MSVGHLVALLVWCVVAVSCGVAPQSPDVVAEVADTVRSERRIRLLFAGDVMAHLPQVAKAKTVDGYDFGPSMRYVAPLFKQADLAVVNLETTLADTLPYSGYPLFRTPAHLAEALSEAGVDVVMLANNHCLDAGWSGVKSTREILSRNGLLYTGVALDSLQYEAQTPLIVERNGCKIAFLNYTYSTNGNRTERNEVVGRIDTVAMARDLKRASEADLRVVYLHWGDEYSRVPSIAQRRVAAFLRRSGAEIVVGSHPHVVQRTECDSCGILLYSLGNFVSNQRWRYSDGGIVAEVDVVLRDEGRDYALNVEPVWVRKSDYAVLPKSVADTLAMSAEETVAYNLFIADTEALICGE